MSKYKMYMMNGFFIPSQKEKLDPRYIRNIPDVNMFGMIICARTDEEAIQKAAEQVVEMLELSDDFLEVSSLNVKIIGTTKIEDCALIITEMPFPPEETEFDVSLN